MKKVLFPIAVMALFFAGRRQPISPESAIVTQYQGYYIFADSRPVAKYEYIGTVKS